MPREKRAVSPAIREKLYAYFETPHTRTDDKVFRQSLHIGSKALVQLRLEWRQDKATAKAQDNKVQKIRDVMENTLGKRPDVEISIKGRVTPEKNPKDPTDEEMKAEVVRGLFAEAKSGNHQAAFRLSQIKGWIIDKQEIIIGQLTADDYARRNTEADRQLAERGHRVAEVQTKPPILLGEIREGEGQVARDNTIRDTTPHRESAQ